MQTNNIMCDTQRRYYIYICIDIYPVSFVCIYIQGVYARGSVKQIAINPKLIDIETSSLRCFFQKHLKFLW